MPKAKGNVPPDPSRPDRLAEMMRAVAMDVLRDPLSWPDETTTFLASFVSLNSIQSFTA